MANCARQTCVGGENVFFNCHRSCRFSELVAPGDFGNKLDPWVNLSLQGGQFVCMSSYLTSKTRSAEYSCSLAVYVQMQLIKKVVLAR